MEGEMEGKPEFKVLFQLRDDVPCEGQIWHLDGVIRPDDVMTAVFREAQKIAPPGYRVTLVQCVVGSCIVQTRSATEADLPNDRPSGQEVPCRCHEDVGQ